MMSAREPSSSSDPVTPLGAFEQRTNKKRQTVHKPSNPCTSFVQRGASWKLEEAALVKMVWVQHVLLPCICCSQSSANRILVSSLQRNLSNLESSNRFPRPEKQRVYASHQIPSLSPRQQIAELWQFQ